MMPFNKDFILDFTNGRFFNRPKQIITDLNKLKDGSKWFKNTVNFFKSGIIKWLLLGWLKNIPISEISYEVFGKIHHKESGGES